LLTARGEEPAVGQVLEGVDALQVADPVGVNEHEGGRCEQKQPEQDQSTARKRPRQEAPETARRAALTARGRPAAQQDAHAGHECDNAENDLDHNGFLDVGG